MAVCTEHFRAFLYKSGRSHGNASVANEPRRTGATLQIIADTFPGGIGSAIQRKPQRSAKAHDGLERNSTGKILYRAIDFGAAPAEMHYHSAALVYE